VAVEVGSELELRVEALDAFARVSALIASGGTLAAAVAAIAEAAGRAAGADVAVVRVLEPEGDFLSARAVAPPASALAAELEGTRLPVESVGTGLVHDLEQLPEAVARSARRLDATSVLFAPALAGERLVGSLELLRSGEPFGASDHAVARLAATQLAVAVHSLDGATGIAEDAGAAALELAGEALAAGVDELRAAREIVRVAAGATRAAAAVLWLLEGSELRLVAAEGVSPDDARLEAARALAERGLADWQPLAVEQGEQLPGAAACSATLQLGAPALGALQLFYPAAAAPSEQELQRLASFAVRGTHALRASGKARELGVELERTRALLAVVGQAIARLSLTHTLETATEQISELLAIERVAVYLREGERLLPAAGRGASGPELARHEGTLAQRLLDLALGAYRARGVVVVPADNAEPALAAVRGELQAAGLHTAVAVPLRVRDEAIGLLAAYPAAGQTLAESDVQLLESLAGQLAVAVQNAQLHEHATRLGDALGEALESERQAARQIRALYEISRSFAQSLSLETTLDAVTRTIVEVLAVDAAAIRVPDQRRDLLVAHAVHVADVRLADAVRTILERPQPWSVAPIQRLFRSREPLLLDAETADRLGGSHALLAPFLAKGSTAAVLPIATPAEVLASLEILSLDPARPIGTETIETALSIAAQAALAIDNARLYQQQKDFADTMQRSLLPDTQPTVPGLELGAIYESAATVAVGGDVYDFLELPDGRLAVAVGDVTGHGIDATADMAMARFTFRSLAREHPEPADFLAHANDVVAEEIAVGKFITMAYLAVDPAGGEIACASAGHPEPRLVRPDGGVEAVVAPGIALGIEPNQTFTEVRVPFPVGATIVLYTDGVIEARRDRELYGTERLDAVLGDCRGLSPEGLAAKVVADCRAFGGELTDDVAVVAIKRTA
jgi:serine phosphatase RsbU (regulator of sigma subunit)